ncbi:hypothetical protein VIBNISOn1_1810057 [Vibrio nigripulchritudo SOn1]|uniref:Uncharacterized protein n=1 Tax=Vibrio nigripulchritudo SOn1 TaxID=1238450 RepID=A0AAV2VQ97_9VIBR|nr:hypothetical protein VIBNISOn1_1810057 [Vibrio nigripulchritudo SOn1]
MIPVLLWLNVLGQVYHAFDPLVFTALTLSRGVISFLRSFNPGFSIM